MISPLRFMAVGTLAAGLALAGCGDDGSSSAGSADPQRYCELVAEASALPFESPDDVDRAAEVIAEAADVAPDEIRDSVELLHNMTQDSADLLRRVLEDPTSLSDDDAAELDAIGSDPDVVAAEEHTVEWEDENCGDGDGAADAGDAAEATESVE